MHYREVPTQRPLHTFEGVSDARRFTFLGPALLFTIAAAIASSSVVGADLYCTRNQGRPLCQGHIHYPARTSVVPSTNGELSSADHDHEADPSERTTLRFSSMDHGAARIERQFASVPRDPLVFDARFYRDSIDAPLRRGQWQRGASFFTDASNAFDAGQSAGYTVRDRRKSSPKTVALSVCFACVAAMVSLAAALARRRYRLRFDPNSDTAWVSHGTLLKMSDEREVRIPLQTKLVLRAKDGVVELAPDDERSTALFSSTQYRDRALFDGLARAVEKARGPIKTVATPLPATLHAPGAIALSLAALALVAVVARHMASIPSDHGTLAISARTRCDYGGFTLLPGGAMQQSVPAGTHSIRVTDDHARVAFISAHVSPDTTTSIECNSSVFSQPEIGSARAQPD